MTIYIYDCLRCLQERELNVPMNDRDSQCCENCKGHLRRKMKFTGSVYAPTSTNGGMK